MESGGSRLCAPISQPSSKSLTYATTLALLGFASRNTNENVKTSEKLKSSSLAFQPVVPSSQDIKAGSTVICPPTPPSRSPPHLHTPSRETSGSDSASSVDEASKKRKLGSRASTGAMAKGAGFASPTLLSPTRAVRSQCAASGSVASSPQEKEFASPTTFVQADTSSFRELVQKLTGASDSDLEKLPITVPSRQSARGAPESPGTHKLDNGFGGLISNPIIDLSPRRPSFKLHERRQSNIRKLELKGLSAAAAFKREATNHGGLSPSAELLSPSNQKVSSLASGPVTPLTMDVSERTYGPRTPTTYEGYTGLKSRSPNLQEERERDAAHFFLHASPSLDPTRPQPELLTLFPLTSPRVTET